MPLRKIGLFALTGLFAVSLVACGQSHDGHGDSTMMDDEHAKDMADHSEHMMSGMGEGMVMVNGTVVEVLADAGRVRIDHEEIPAINMAAMTMSFQTGGEVDLSRFNADDDVHFMLKQGRDGSYRIMHMCKTDGSDAACMAGMGN